jgi:RecJ-like exonuclease
MKEEALRTRKPLDRIGMNIMTTQTHEPDPERKPAQVQLNPGDDAQAGTPGTGEDICQECHGSGKVAGGMPCPNCGGTGRIVEGIGGG